MMKLDVNIHVKQGRFLLDAAFCSFDPAFGIFGPSGSGKSTLFRALAGLIRPSGGFIRLDDETLFDSDRRVFVPPHKRGIGLVFQDARLFPHWTVEENLRAGEKVRKNVAKRPYSFDDMVDLLEISPLIGRSVQQLSGGEKQRVALGRALLSAPRLLLMDEPVSGLDVSLKAQILPFLAEAHRRLNIPTVLISHDLGEILQLTDRLLLIRHGKVTGCGPIGRLMQEPEIRQALKGTDLTHVLHAGVVRRQPEKGATMVKLALADYMPPVPVEFNEQPFPGAAIPAGVSAGPIALPPRRVRCGTGFRPRSAPLSALPAVRCTVWRPQPKICLLKSPPERNGI